MPTQQAPAPQAPKQQSQSTPPRPKPEFPPNVVFKNDRPVPETRKK